LGDVFEDAAEDFFGVVGGDDFAFGFVDGEAGVAEGAVIINSCDVRIVGLGVLSL